MDPELKFPVSKKKRSEVEFLLQSSSIQPNCRARLTIHICRSSRNSDTGFTPQTNRWSRARVQAT